MELRSVGNAPTALVVGMLRVHRFADRPLGFIARHGRNIRRRMLERRLLVPFTVTAFAGAISFRQQPGLVFLDTRVEFIANPSLFLDRLLSVWTNTIDLGHIQTSQFTGYLFPMAPFFALGDQLGVPPWIVQRLWIWALLAMAAWGTVRLIEELRPGLSGWAPLIAGAIYVVTPFVTISLNRGSIWLIPYALLPWMLLGTKRGIDDPSNWKWPALIAVLAAASSTSITPLVWLILALLTFCVFELIFGSSWRAIARFGIRTSILSVVLSLWWIVPVLAQFRFGTDYLTFTEHPETILHTTSASESLRLLGYWLTYLNGDGSSAEMPAMSFYLLNSGTILATFLIPAIALLTLAFNEKWKYSYYFGFLIGLAVLLMSAGFPQDSFNGRLLTDILYGSGPLQFMRTAYKAAPLVALSVSILCGIGLGAFVSASQNSRVSVNRRRVPRWPLVASSLGFVALLIYFVGQPLVLGKAIDQRRAFVEVPGYWQQAIDYAATEAPRDSRIAILPGDALTWYTWGGTQDSVGPALTGRPVLIRQIVRAASPNSAQLLESTDSLVQQCRLAPGQLNPLLRLMGVGLVLVPADSSVYDSKTLGPAEVSECLRDQRGFRRPIARFGALTTFAPPTTEAVPAVDLPQIRAYAAPRPAEPGIKRVHQAAGATILDGDADGVVTMAAVGALNPNRALFYSADIDQLTLRDEILQGATLAFTDSNRRAPVIPSQTRSRTGYTLAASQTIPRAFPNYRPFGTDDSTVQTVATYTGVKNIFSPVVNSFALVPAHRPYAAFDGNSATQWIAQSPIPSQQWLEVTFRKPRTISSVWLKPHFDNSAATSIVSIFANNKFERAAFLSPGWNRVTVNTKNVTNLRFKPATQDQPFGNSLTGNPGFDEIRIPGLRVREYLRLPTDLPSKANSAIRDDEFNSVPMTVGLSRVTQDFPRWSGASGVPASVLSRDDRSPVEESISRVVSLPTSADFTATGWASLNGQVPDDKIDSLLGSYSADRFRSSERLGGFGRYRASNAFDGKPSTSWQARFDSFNPPWLEWKGAAPVAFDRIKITVPEGGFARPVKVRVITPLGTIERPVSKTGVVSMPRRLTARRVKLEFADVKQELRGPVVAASEIKIGSIGFNPGPTRSRFTSKCGEIVVTSSRGHDRQQTLALKVSGTVADLQNGGSLKLRSCGDDRIRLVNGRNFVDIGSSPLFMPDQVGLTRAGVNPHDLRPAGGSIGPAGNVNLDGPGWLVLANSYSSGWRAWCTDSLGRKLQLGSPRPIDGFANGWRINGKTCKRAGFAFGPQETANWALLFSLIGGLIVIPYLLVVALRRPKRRSPTSPRVPKRSVALNYSRLGASLSVEPDSAGGRKPMPTGGPTWSRSVFLLSAAVIGGCGLSYVLRPEDSIQGVNYGFPLSYVTEHWLIALVALTLTFYCLVAPLLSRRLATRKAKT